MGFPLSHSFHHLDREERNRIQKRLGIILGKSDQIESSRRSLKSIYKRMGKPTEVIRNFTVDQREVFFELLESFGLLKIDERSTERSKNLASNPYLVFNEKDSAFYIASEALDVILEDPDFKKEGFLISHIHSLTLHEKRAWQFWLGKSSHQTGRTRLTRVLWRAIAEIRRSLYPGEWPFQHTPENQTPLLNDFPDRPGSSSLSWFYRDLIPFYRAAREEMDRLKKDEGVDPENGKSRSSLEKIRLGFLIPSMGPQEFGKPVNWILKTTREKIPPEIPADLEPERKLDREGETGLFS